MITIIDYEAGNIKSVQRTCSEIGAHSTVTNNPAKIAGSQKIIFPGVGAAPSTMNYIRQAGLDIALKHAFENGVPILGICLGAQVILDSSEEGDQPCLGLIRGETVRFRLNDTKLKIPHMGWNEVKAIRSHPLLDRMEEQSEYYFVHSFYPRPAEEMNIYATSDHGITFCSALGAGNLFATQFHPEKSGRPGLQLLERFVAWDGTIPSERTAREVA